MLQPSVLLVVLGLILGPGYYAYCEHLSGEQLQTITMSERADRWVLPDGSIQRFRSGLGYRPVEILLRPDLSRVRLTLEFQFPQDATVENVEYLATLTDADYPMLEVPIALRSQGTVSVPLRTLDIETAGAYLFILEEVGNKPHPEARIAVHLRGRIETVLRPLMGFGYALILIGLALAAYRVARGVRGTARR